MKLRQLDVCAVITALALVLPMQATADELGEWTEIDPPAHVTAFAASPGAEGVLYAASDTDGVFHSDDGGETWTARNAGLDLTEITAIATAPNLSSRVVVAEEGGSLQVSNNAGASWSSDASGAVALVTAIVFDPDDDDIVYALDDGQGAVLKSTDGGATWTSHTAGLPGSAGTGDQLALVVVPLLPDTLYTGTSDGVFKSEDGGETWATAQDNLPSTEVLALAAHPVEPETIAGLFQVGSEVQFWRSNKGGTEWYRPAVDQDTKFRAQAVTVDPHDPSRLLLGGGNGVFGSVDAAHHWVTLNEGLQPDVDADDRSVPFVSFDPHTTLKYYTASEGVLQVYEGLIASDLVVSATRDPGRVDADETVDIEFAVANITGEPAHDIELTFEAPAGFEIDDWSITGGECTEDATTLSCEVDRLGPGDDMTGTVVARAVGDEGLHDFTVSAFASARDATPDSNTVTFSVRIGEVPDDDDDDDGDGGGGGGGGGGDGGGDGNGGGGGDGNGGGDGDGNGGGDGDGDGGGDGDGNGDTGPDDPPPSPTPPRSGGGGGNGGWLWLLGTGIALLVRPTRLQPLR